MLEKEAGTAKVKEELDVATLTLSPAGRRGSGLGPIH